MATPNPCPLSPSGLDPHPWAALALIILLGVTPPAQGSISRYFNPVFGSGSEADPDVIRHNGMYYAYISATTPTAGYKVYRSMDLVNWSEGPQVFTGGTGLWAPDVCYNPSNQTFCLYYTADSPTNPANKVIGVATCATPDGNFTDQGVLTDGVDAHLFADDDGSLYLFYKGAANLCVNKLTDLTHLGPTTISWTAETTDAEGPFVLKHNGTYYLLYSYNGAMGPTYAVGYATATNPLGPWTRYPGNPIVSRTAGPSWYRVENTTAPVNGTAKTAAYGRNYWVDFNGQSSPSGGTSCYLGNYGGAVTWARTGVPFAANTSYHLTWAVGLRNNVGGADNNDQIELYYYNGTDITPVAQSAALKNLPEYTTTTGWQNVSFSYRCATGGAEIGKEIVVAFRRNRQDTAPATYTYTAADGHWQSNVDDPRLDADSTRIWSDDLDDRVYGPGHGSVIADDAGALWHIYHQKLNPTWDWSRAVCLDPLWFDGQGVLHSRTTRGSAQNAPTITVPVFTWTGATSTAWTNAANWSPAVPDVFGDAVIATTTGKTSLNLTDSRTIRSLIFGDTSNRTTAFTITGSTAACTLTLTNDFTANGAGGTLAAVDLFKIPVTIANDQIWTVGGSPGSATSDAGIRLVPRASGTPNALTLTGTLTKSGPGQLSLVGQNVANGNIVVNQGSLKLNAGSGSVLTVGGSGSITANRGASIMLSKNSGTFEITKPFVMNAGSSLQYGSASAQTASFDMPVSWTGAVTMEYLATATQTNSFTNNWSGDAAITLTQNGATAGYLQLSGNNTHLSGSFTHDCANQRVRFLNENASSSSVAWSLATSSACLETFGPANINLGSLAGPAGSVRNSNPDASPATVTVGALDTSADFGGVLADNTAALGLVKVGSGTFTLSGASTYSGPTTVSAGTLATAAANALPGGTTVNLAGGTLALGAAATVSALQFDGRSQVAGSWGSVNSGAAHPSVRFTGSGVLTVATGAAATFASWVDGFFAGAAAPAVAGFAADPDGDGVPNGLEWILGGNPNSPDAASLLTPSTGSVAGMTLRFTREESSLGVAELAAQWTTDPAAPWHDIPITQGGGSYPNGIEVAVNQAATPDVVTVTIPQAVAPAGRLFLRLRAVMP